MEKIIKGQFFTKNKVWLKKHIVDFIKNTKTNVIYDPFAGQGDMFKIGEIVGITNYKGLDIDVQFGYPINDSLVSIPKINNSIIITNPPYISKNSATRKNMNNKLNKYFENNKNSDIYLIALEKMLESSKYVVAIVPETFINSKFKYMNRLNSYTIIEDNPFIDTVIPICVVCFDDKDKETKYIKIYKNNKYLFTLKELESKKLKPNNNVKIKFNDINGWLGVKLYDGIKNDDRIKFDLKKNFKYDFKNKMKSTSRHLSLINIEILPEYRVDFVNKCNIILNKYRNDIQDISLSPFKCNNKNNIRRRRLDFKTARAILEKAYTELFM